MAPFKEHYKMVCDVKQNTICSGVPHFQNPTVCPVHARNKARPFQRRFSRITICYTFSSYKRSCFL